MTDSNQPEAEGSNCVASESEMEAGVAEAAPTRRAALSADSDESSAIEEMSHIPPGSQDQRGEARVDGHSSQQREAPPTHAKGAAKTFKKLSRNDKDVYEAAKALLMTPELTVEVPKEIFSSLQPLNLPTNPREIE